MLKTRSDNPWLRAAVWEARECGTLGRDLWRSRTWPYWYSPANDPRVFVVFLAALGLSLLYVVAHTTWLTLSLWIVVGWAVTAAATAVVRRRHYLRLDIRLAVQSVTGGHQRREPSEHQRHSKVKRPRLRWELGTATLKSGIVKVPGTWARGNPEKIDQLDQELRRRIAYHGNYALDWPVGQAVGRLRKVFPLPYRIDAQHTWNPAGRGVLLGVTESCHHPGHCPTHAAPTHDGLYWARWLQTDDPHMLAAGSTGLGKTTMLRWLIYSLILSARAEGRGVRIAGLDGKSAGNLAFLDGRKGTIGKEAANTPDEWVKVINAVKAEMTGRYEA
ncbi:MAG TPA: FtsK/SpoIIIE domain-containing protein, partial [Candidatus Nanopelagicales bacterium]|nr:FtsK/SpoIIIE domain-containing protein [Candidatus Nanopelagicales bacterium]